MLIHHEITALQRLTIRQLRARYAKVYGEEQRPPATAPGSSNGSPGACKRWPKANLTERARRRAANSPTTPTFVRARPKDKQAAVATTDRTETAVLARSRRTTLPPAGTILTREYKGAVVQVQVLQQAFEYARPSLQVAQCRGQAVPAAIARLPVFSAWPHGAPSMKTYERTKPADMPSAVRCGRLHPQIHGEGLEQDSTRWTLSVRARGYIFSQQHDTAGLDLPAGALRRRRLHRGNHDRPP